LQTERVYVQSLNDIVYKWQKPLEDQTTSKAPPCSMEQIGLIFANIASVFCYPYFVVTLFIFCLSSDT
jgi:hypothetical protein